MSVGRGHLWPFNANARRPENATSMLKCGAGRNDILVLTSPREVLKEVYD